jgi:MATE family multidrug resistance protein
MFAMGLSITAMIRIGNQKGLEDYVTLRKVGISIFLLTIIIEFVFALLFVALHNVLPYIFVDINDVKNLTENLEVIAISANLLLVAAIFQISDGLQVVILGALRGLQDAKIPMYMTFVAYWIIGFPISIYLGLETELKAFGVWIGLLAGLTAAALFLYIRFNYLTKKLVQEQEQIQIQKE